MDTLGDKHSVHEVVPSSEVEMHIINNGPLGTSTMSLIQRHPLFSGKVFSIGQNQVSFVERRPFFRGSLFDYTA